MNISISFDTHMPDRIKMLIVLVIVYISIEKVNIEKSGEIKYRNIRKNQFLFYQIDKLIDFLCTKHTKHIKY